MPVLLYLLAVAVFAQGTSEFVLAGLLPGIATDLEVSLGQAGLLTSGFALGMAVGAPAMAAAGRRVSPRWTLTSFLALFIAAHVVGALTDSFAVMLASRIVAAFANAGFLAVALSTVTRIVPAERHTRALAIILGGTTLALIAGVPAGAFVGDVLGWRATLWAIALLCLPALAAVLAATPTEPPETAEASAGNSIGRELASLRSRPVQLNFVLAVLINAATFCTFTYLAAIATGPAGLTERTVPALLAVFGIGAFVGVSAAGRFGDRHWRHLITFTGPLLMAGWALLALTTANPAALWLLAFTLGALSFALGSTLIARIIATAHDAPTMGGSFATVALNIGAVVGPIAGGLAIEAGGVRGPIIVSAALVLLAVAVWTATSLIRRGLRIAPPEM
ncbi:Cmx/CmrA family chloramphenicol efflux MFS transporter [Brachybacterium paraconglomeratum]|uniref:Cmx/CmrA family chloramphenicol efflux MFS transporter n=1 Tax=Brachybacterium paraconglomeratum TaxID=173362 RepID=UPI00223C109C|nr:Cmx/CmrA family chloramphenicol efflux MFS transporter [Brachybacterium paraconglomeratum]MCT1438788.1 MFS transporter [Brachybacterium paraconglomeratum]